MASSNGKSSLFIGDLAIFCSEREIEDAFSPYGEIQEIKIMRSEETSRNLSYGFIKFSSAQAAKRAMTELNGVILCGRPLRFVFLDGLLLILHVKSYFCALQDPLGDIQEQSGIEGTEARCPGNFACPRQFYLISGALSF